MNKIYYLLLFSLSCFSISYSQPYAPAAGLPGSTAIPYDSTCFVAWATHVEVTRGFVNINDTNVSYQGSNRASFGSPTDAIGSASNSSTDAVSLGDSGIAIITFEYPITNEWGYDFAIFENGVTDNFLELGLVEVSSDGSHYIRFPAHSNTQTNTPIGSFGSVNPQDIYNLAGKYRVGYGTPFDLEEIKDSIGIDINKITHVKIIDAIGAIGTHYTVDANGNKINGIFPTPFHTGGFDLNAIGVIHELIPENANLSFQKNLSSILVYPNPSKGKIHLKWSDIQIHKIIITDLIGQKIQTTIPSNNTITLNLKKGGYFIQFLTHNSCIRKRVIVQ